jgi:hypothetical protein
MWQRRTFHECAEELSAISADFRAAHTNKFKMRTAEVWKIKFRSSRRGVEILRILALSIRGDQDYGLTKDDRTPIGALRTQATDADVDAAIHRYHPPYSDLAGFAPLSLRQALNKIAHADPARSGFYADDEIHDLILTGVNQGETWIAVISLIELCRVIMALPDAKTRQ